MKIKTTQIQQAAVKIANCKDIKKKDISKSLIKTADKNTNEKKKLDKANLDKDLDNAPFLWVYEYIAIANVIIQHIHKTTSYPQKL